MDVYDRLCHRLKSRFPVLYKNPDDSHWTRGYSADISTSGIGILICQVLEGNSAIDLRLIVPGRIRKITLRGRVVNQMPAKEKNSKLFLAGIRFEEVSEKALDTITKFIINRLNMTGLRVFALLAGLTAFAASLFRFLYYSVLGLFQGTTFGKEWLTGIWGSFPSAWIAYFYATMAVLVLVACFCFSCMQKRASRGLFVVATVGLLDQGIRWALKIPCLLGDLPSTWIFLAETGLLALWGTLVWVMIRHGKNYEQTLGSMREDAGFKPASPEPPPKEIPPSVNHVFLP